MDLSFCNQIDDGKKYTGSLSVDAILNHILNLNLFFYYSCRLYLYWSPEGRYILIDSFNEWHVISSFLSEKIRRSIRAKQINELMFRLKNTLEIQRNADDFNANTDLINMSNGVLNWKTKDLMDFNQEYNFNYRLNVSYVKNAKFEDAPFFLKFCNSSLDGDVQRITLLLQILGYLFSPLINAKKCFIFLGEPNCGKSLLIHLIETIFGEEFISNIPLEKLGERFSTSTLSTKRINICAELSSRPLRDIETFKLVVGGDTLTGEFKNKDQFNFHNRCKLLFAGNILPPIKNEDVTTAFTDRLVILRFPHSIPKKERNYNLAKSLEEEADVIFSLAINTLQDLVKCNYEFDIPENTMKLLNDYAFNQTHIETFVNEWCERKKGLRIHSSSLYKSYKKFCIENAITPISQNLFSQKINTFTGVESSRFRIDGSKPMRGYIGISLKKIYEQDSEMYSNDLFEYFSDEL